MAVKPGFVKPVTSDGVGFLSAGYKSGDATSRGSLPFRVYRWGSVGQVPPVVPPLFASNHGPIVVGHRGAPAEAKENTSAAFAAAAVGGATWVELDARLNADGVVVVHHDPVHADGRAVVEFTTAECDAAGIATLAAILEGLPPELGVDVEIKNLPGEPDHDPAMAVVGACARDLADFAKGRPLLISSFNPMVLLAAKGMGLAHPLGLLTFGTPLRMGVEAASDIGCAALCPHHSTDGLDSDGVAGAHAAELQVLAWTVDDDRRASQLAGQGVDALCTNDPRRIAEVLRVTPKD